MTIEKIIGKLVDIPKGKRVDAVSFEWFERSRRILKKTTAAGEEIGLRLQEPLNDGDVLHEDDERAIVAFLAPCELTRASAPSMKEMGRVCFELGNRHLPISIGDHWVETPYDHPTFEYLEKLGFKCERVTCKFEPDALSHSHG
jgi:urease accessory protein